MLDIMQAAGKVGAAAGRDVAAVRASAGQRQLTDRQGGAGGSRRACEGRGEQQQKQRAMWELWAHSWRLRLGWEGKGVQL